MPNASPPDGSPRPRLDASVANVARVYDYLLGGKDNFAADREAAEAAIATFPGIVRAVRANRAFLGRAVRYLAGEAGIRQFLDIGTGIPTAGNTHEVAQDAAPASRIVYVDNDPMVLSHARALLTSTPQGSCAYIDADLRDTGTILTQAASTLDFSQPVAIMLVAILHFIPDEEAYAITGRLTAALAPGSYLAISHVARDIQAETMGEIIDQANQLVAQKTTPRTREEVTRFFDGLDLVEPGVVAQHEWRPDSDLAARNRSVGWSGVARKRLAASPPAGSAPPAAVTITIVRGSHPVAEIGPAHRRTGADLRAALADVPPPDEEFGRNIAEAVTLRAAPGAG